MASSKGTDSSDTAAEATAASQGAKAAVTATEEPAAGRSTAASKTVTADDIRFSALRNAIYHSSRRGFLDFLNRCLSFLVVAGGTAAVADVGRALNVTYGWFAAIAALAGLAQLVFDFGGKARTHEFLQRRFYELVADVAECEIAKESDCMRWDAVLNRLYAEEPPPMRALDAIAYNAALDSLGRDARHRIPITWTQSVLRHIWPFNEVAF